MAEFSIWAESEHGFPIGYELGTAYDEKREWTEKETKEMVLKEGQKLAKRFLEQGVENKI